MYYVWLIPNPAGGGGRVPAGLYEHPPPAGGSITYVTVAHDNATWFLRQSQVQLTKWVAWTRRIPFPP